MYLAPNTVNNMKGNSVFEIDLLPTGDMTFKKSNGKSQFVNVATTNDMMAVLGTTTKGGEINTSDCYGYCLELFIPWEYMDKFDLNSEAMKESYVYVDPAHITSFNYEGTNMDVDRYWYFFGQQNGASYANVYQYFRFDGNGVQGTVPVELLPGENCMVEGATAVIPGMPINVTVTPDDGYAIRSVLVNGEEYIHSASFNEDGSVTINARGVKGGMQISAAAVPVTEGTKTLTGTVFVNKLGGDALQGVTVSYRGAAGEKTVELGTDGKFILADMEPGYYTFTIQKAGYEKLIRTIYVNRDMEATFALEYKMFTATGYRWGLEKQNSGVLYAFGGSGELLTNDSYSKFTAEATFKHNTALENISDYGAFNEQRQGYKIVFSNGKTWHIDLVKQDGKYYVEYAKHSGDNSMTGWKKVYELTTAEADRYTAEGVKLSIQRDENYANLYLDGKLIAVEVLDKAYASCTAQIGFERWVANREIEEISYDIKAATSVELKNTLFSMTNGWDVSQQYDGILSIPKRTGSYASLYTVGSTYRDMAVTVQDLAPTYGADGKGNFQMQIRFIFAEGKEYQIRLHNTDANGKYKVQNMGGDNCITGWKWLKDLSDAQTTKLQNEGIQFRVALIGTDAKIYIDGIEIAVVDLSENITVDTTAQIRLMMYGNNDVENLRIPFVLNENAENVNITFAENTANGTVSAAKTGSFVVGERVLVNATPATGYNLAGLIVKKDGVAIDSSKIAVVEGKYSFVAEAGNYTVEGIFAPSRFVENANIDMSNQYNGSVTILNGSNNGRTLKTTENTYREMSVTIRDFCEGTFKTEFHFTFTNGKQFQIRVENEKGYYAVQNMAKIVSGWTRYKFDENQTAKILSEEGITFRVAIEGTDAVVYLDDVKMVTLDLSAGIAAGDTAQIAMVMYGNNGVQNIEVPFTLS
jgi:hypothetical protein